MRYTYRRRPVAVLVSSSGDGLLVGRVIERLEGDRDLGVRHAAASALWEVPLDAGSVRRLAALRAAEADPTVRAALVELLGFQSHREAREALREAARSDPEEAIRARAKELAER